MPKELNNDVASEFFNSLFANCNVPEKVDSPLTSDPDDINQETINRAGAGNGSFKNDADLHRREVELLNQLNYQLTKRIVDLETIVGLLK